MTGPSIIQLVLGSNNLPFSKHLYTTVFGFAAAGDRIVYSAHNGQVMGLGDYGGAMVSYLVGRQELMQLEFWTHTTPTQRPLPADWRPNDIGFTRFGVCVDNFDGVLQRLTDARVPTLTPVQQRNGLRRVCFHDPTLGIPVEIMEEGGALVGDRDRYHDLDPAVVYVTVSVTDLDEAVEYFADVVGLQRVDVLLHQPQDEEMWGLAGARRRTEVLLGGSTFLELVQYEWPAGRPRPLEDPLNAQGFKTVAVGHRDPAATGAIFERVKAAGFSWTVSEPASFIGGNHVIGRPAYRMKTLSVPLDVERQFGYSPEPPTWWRPPSTGQPQHTDSGGDTAAVMTGRASMTSILPLPEPTVEKETAK
ncbi:MAG: hypothetical protein M3Y49_16630 [Actinomycetota bacterium]|nr:hypothetical protein [Actinomycetota bacterium]